MILAMYRIFIVTLVSMMLMTGGSVFGEESGNGKSKNKTAAKTAPEKSSGTRTKSKKNLKDKTTKKTAKKGKADKPKPVVVAVRPPEPRLKAAVQEIRSWSNPDYTRISVSLDREATFESHRLGKEQDPSVTGRLYLDINNARINPGVKDLQVADGLLKTARIAQYKPDTVRVVLDLESIKDYKIFTFSDPFRIMIDVRGDRRAEISNIKPVIRSSAPLPETVTAEPADKPRNKTLHPSVSRIRRVVVDPGHGGHDPGAVGGEGTREKDVVLSIGMKLAKKLREELGLDVVMTRSSDVFLELQERTAIANQVGADLFLSIHANAAPNRQASGIETYYLSLAKTEKAAQLAAKENGTSLEKVSMLQAVLFDLMANYKINDSAHLAEVVQKELYRRIDSRWPVKSLGVKQGPFYVLVGATMPSILVETAFLSNDKDEQRLKDPEYHDVTAEGITEGVRGYINSLK